MGEVEAQANAARRAADEAAVTAEKAKAQAETIRATEGAEELAINAAADAAKAAAETAAKREAEAAEKALELEGQQKLLASLREMCDRLDADAAKRTIRPVYTLRVPNFRLNSLFDECYYDVPVAPSDRKLWQALKTVVQTAGAEFGVTTDDADFQALEKAFRESGGAKVPQEVAGLFEDLFARVSDHAEVRKILKQRKAHRSGLTMLRLRFYVAGIEGLPGAEAFRVERGQGEPCEMATEDSIGLIPPDDIDAILDKLDDLSTARGREGNS
ncbi:MAG: hypothetical protein ACLGJC_20590 [Alphaproteobacteria bacterium]